MTRLLAVLLAASLLAACGANGPPTRPEPDNPRSTDVSISGTATIGVSGTF